MFSGTVFLLYWFGFWNLKHTLENGNTWKRFRKSFWAITPNSNVRDMDFIVTFYVWTTITFDLTFIHQTQKNNIDHKHLLPNSKPFNSYFSYRKWRRSLFVFIPEVGNIFPLFFSYFSIDVHNELRLSFPQPNSISTVKIFSSILHSLFIRSESNLIQVFILFWIWSLSI